MLRRFPRFLLVQHEGSVSLDSANVCVGLKNSDDVGVKFDLLAEVLKNGVVISSGQVNDVPGGSSGFNNAILRTIGLGLSSDPRNYLGYGDGDFVPTKLFDSAYMETVSDDALLTSTTTDCRTWLWAVYRFAPRPKLQTWCRRSSATSNRGRRRKYCWWRTALTTLTSRPQATN